jgi:hypothetical protein
MKQLTYTTVINAGKQQVWENMLHPNSYKDWVNAAWPGSIYEGKWAIGETLKFMTVDGSGTVAKLTGYDPYNTIVANHVAVLFPGGIEDRDSEVAKGWIGTMERYTFTEQGGRTTLTVVLTINPEWEKMFNEGWPGALAALKEICESKYALQ